MDLHLFEELPFSRLIIHSEAIAAIGSSGLAVNVAAAFSMRVLAIHTLRVSPKFQNASRTIVITAG